VADSEQHCVFVLNAESLSPLRRFGRFGSRDGELNAPAGVAYNQVDKHVYVADSRNSRVCVFTLDGTFVCSFGRKGIGPGEFTRPHGVAIVDEFLLVAEDRRLQVLTLKGDVRQVLRVQADSLRGICVTRSRNVVVIDAGAQAAHVLEWRH